MILVKNGLLIDPASNLEGEYDLLIEGETIRDVVSRGSLEDSVAAQVIDATGKWVLPGLVDIHVHLREPGFEWKSTVKDGAIAAVAGGYTSICCMPNTDPTNDSAEVTKFILKKAADAGAARVYPIGAVSLGLKGQKMSPFSELRKAGCVAFSDDGEPVFNSGLMRRALEWCSMLDAVICCHEEDKCLACGGVMNESPLSLKMGLKGWPSIAEEVMIARDIELARHTGARVHFCHVSTARGVELIRRAKNDGIAVSAEVTPHHLLLTEAAIGDYDTNAKMMPPLRDDLDVEGVRAGLADGTIDAIASDHAPHELDAKRVEFDKAAVGVLGLQTSLPLLLELVSKGVLTRMRAVEALSTKPAETLGLPGGTVKRGAPADLCIVDADHRYVFTEEMITTMSCNSPFIGRELCGIADTTIVAGKIVLRGRQLEIER